jgi:hypothetical protein
MDRFRAILYPCPETQNERREMSMGVMTRIEDLNTVSIFHPLNTEFREGRAGEIEQVKCYDVVLINFALPCYFSRKHILFIAKIDQPLKMHVAVISCSVSSVTRGIESDAGPSSSCVGGGCEKHQSLVHQSSQDQSYLPHAEHVQLGRNAKVSHQRMLVP